MTADSVSEDITIQPQTAEKEEQTQKNHNAIITYPHASTDMGIALAKKQSIMLPKVGELTRGVVLDISKNGIVVNIEGKLTGLVRGKELDDESGQYSKLSIGDPVEATVLEMENEQGMLELSFRQAGHRKAWDLLSELQESGEIVEAKIIDANKGGLMVKVGNVEGFLPVSQLTVEHYPRVEGGDKNRILDRLRTHINQMFKVKVITVREREEKLIVSEKAAWEKQQTAQLSKYNVGDEVSGRATGVVDFGVFVEFGDGLEGLVHISELAWQRIDNPSDVVKVGDEIKAKIISVDGGRVSLSVKKLVDDPWKKASEKYKVGDKVQGKVLKINPYGAFVELDRDIHGLAHVSELNEKEEQDMSKLLKVGEMHDFKILSIEPAAHRLGLGIA
ncbi:30S ribosomal protein S1 [bacterium]|jgi:small subunit ribosomal protein S1|nr:30S ribosomal protein S1 [bacterium]MDP6571501.1 S1 RNA-binding domain-containing protein [Patescibacteria group bacterium]MDP6756151.1 S1 RNA-binding domain-containing protein [Patescibacteria group bacterium]|tara:strand:- start:5895 stop:7064 length:1170 start_codon:yes stop_codon:yes gene_type:complete